MIFNIIYHLISKKYYLCKWFKQLNLCFIEINEALCFSCNWKRRKFSNGTRDGIAVSTHLAWAAISTYCAKVSYDLRLQCGIQYHASFMHKSLLGTEKAKKLCPTQNRELKMYWWSSYLILFLILIGISYIFIMPFLVAAIANNKGRDGVLWFFLSLILNPLFSILILIGFGDTDEKRKQRIIEEEKLRISISNRYKSDNNTNTTPRESDHSRFMPH